MKFGKLFTVIFSAVFLAGVFFQAVDCADAGNVDAEKFIEQLSASINTGNREGFLALFDSNYDYNNEDVRSLTRYFFAMEGAEQGRRQELNVSGLEADSENSRIGFEYTNCMGGAGKGQYSAFRLCGGGKAVIEIGKSGRISALRPVETYMKENDEAKLPEFKKITIDGKEFDTEWFREDISFESGRTILITCQMGGNIGSISIGMGQGLIAAQMERMKDEKGQEIMDMWETSFVVPELSENLKNKRFFLYFKPYLSSENEYEAVKVITLPVIIRSGKKH